MKRLFLFSLFAAGLAVSAGAQAYNPYDRLPHVPSFTVTSTDVKNGAQMPQDQMSGIFGAGGKDISPQLSWKGFPAGTKSFVVTMYDPDAPTASGFWHWAVVDIPASVTSLKRGAGDDKGTGIPARRLPASQRRAPGALCRRSPAPGQRQASVFHRCPCRGCSLARAEQGRNPGYARVYSFLTHAGARHDRSLGRALICSRELGTLARGPGDGGHGLGAHASNGYGYERDELYLRWGRAAHPHPARVGLRVRAASADHGPRPAHVSLPSGGTFSNSL